MIKKELLMFCLLLSFGSKAQSVDEVLKKTVDKFASSKTLTFSSKYNLYKNHNTPVVHQTYNGFFIKNSNNEVYLKIDNTEFINTKEAYLKVSHNEKAIEVTDKQPFSTAEFDMKKLIKFCEISSFKNRNTFWEIVLIPKMHSDLRCSRIVLNISKSYFLQKQTFYYNYEMNFSNDFRNHKGDYPRLEVLYSNHSDRVSDLSKINSRIYFTVNSKNQITTTSKYKNYEVFDSRSSAKTEE